MADFDIRKVYDALTKLLPTQLNEVILTAGAPRQHLSTSQVPIAQRAGELVEWAEQSPANSEALRKALERVLNPSGERKDLDLLDVRDKLETLKRCHEEAHVFYKNHYKPALLMLERRKPEDVDWTECRSAIDRVLGVYRGVIEDKEKYKYLDSIDRNHLATLIGSLQECKQTIGSGTAEEAWGKSRLPALKEQLRLVGGHLGTVLSHFNWLLGQSTSRLRPEHGLTARDPGNEELARLAEFLTTSHKPLLWEHDTLQGIHDRLSPYIFVQILAKEEKLAQFLEESWPRIRQAMDQLRAAWAQGANDDQLDNIALGTRSKLAEEYQKLVASLGAGRESQIDLDCYSGFVRVFDQYFINLDEILRGKYAQRMVRFGDVA